MERLREQLSAELRELDPKQVTHACCLEIVRTRSLSFERLEFLANYLTDQNWAEVCEERACDSICGWPLCGTSTAWTAEKPAIVMQANSRKGVQILDRTELFQYCGAEHMELSKQVEASLNAEPWWLRASKTRPVDLGWLSILLASAEMDAMEVDPNRVSSSTLSSLSSDLNALHPFPIIEHAPIYDQEAAFSGSHFSTRSVAFNDPSTDLTHQLHDLEPFEYRESEPRTPTDSIEGASRPETPGMNVDGSDRYSDDDSDDETTANFFNATFTKQSLPHELSPSLQIMNMMLHWVTWKSQKFSSFSDYKPHLHNASMHISSQFQSEMVTNDQEEDIQRHLPPIDGLDVEISRRRVLTQFVNTRLTSIANDIPAIERTAVMKSIDTLISTFDLTAPIEGLKTNQWNNVTVALLGAVASRHPGLSETVNAHHALLQTNFQIDWELVQDLLKLFIHHG